MKTLLTTLAALALVAGSALAQEDSGRQGRRQRQGGADDGDSTGRQGRMEQRAKRAHQGGENRPGGPMSPEMMEELRAEHHAIRGLATAARNETDETRKAELVDQLRVKLGEVADRVQAHQETRLAQAEEQLATLKERIDYARENRDELIEEQLERILSGERPMRPGAFRDFPYAKEGYPPPPPPPFGPDMPEHLPPPPLLD